MKNSVFSLVESSRGLSNSGYSPGYLRKRTATVSNIQVVFNLPGMVATMLHRKRKKRTLLDVYVQSIIATISSN